MGIWSRIKHIFVKSPAPSYTFTLPPVSGGGIPKAPTPPSAPSKSITISSTGGAGRVSTGGGGGGGYIAPAPTKPSDIIPTGNIQEELAKPSTPSPLISKPSKSYAQLYPKQIGMPPEKLFEPTRITTTEAVYRSVKRTPKGIVKSARGLFTEFDVTSGLSYIAEPWRLTGKQIGEEKVKVSGEPYFGTITAEEYLPTRYKGFEGTKFEYAKSREVLDPRLHERAGVRITEYAPIAAETGMLVGASFTPAGAGVASGYLVGRGFGQTVTAPTITGKALGVGTTGLGFVGVGATMTGLRTSITRGEIQEAVMRKPDFRKGLRIESKGMTTDYFPQKYKFGGAEVMKESVISYVPTEKGMYAVGGRGSVLVRTSEHMTGRTILYGTRTKFIGGGEGLGVGTGGFEPTIALGKTSKEMEFFMRYKKPYTAKGKIDLYAPSERLMVGGISKKQEDLIISYSGRVKEIKGRWATPSGIEIERGGFKFDVEDVALTKTITKPKIETFKITRAGKQTPLSKTFRSTTKQKLTTDIKPFTPTKPTSRVISRELTTPTISKTITTGKLGLGMKTIQRASLSTAQLSKQLSKQKTKTLSRLKPKLRSEQLLKPSQEYFSVQKMLQRTKTKQITQPKLTTRITTPSIIDPTIPGLGTGGFVFPLIKGTRLGRGVKFRKTQLGKQPTKYQPSFTALALGIKSFKIPKAYKAGAGGLIIRPIITKKKTKRKKK